MSWTDIFSIISTVKSGGWALFFLLVLAIIWLISISVKRERKLEKQHKDLKFELKLLDEKTELLQETFSGIADERVEGFASSSENLINATRIKEEEVRAFYKELGSQNEKIANLDTRIINLENKTQ